jgi:hypothetical protein
MSDHLDLAQLGRRLRGTHSELDAIVLESEYPGNSSRRFVGREGAPACDARVLDGLAGRSGNGHRCDSMPTDGRVRKHADVGGHITERREVDGPGRATGETTPTPARPTHIPTPALRTSHFPDPPNTNVERRSRPPLDTEGSHDRADRGR